MHCTVTQFPWQPVVTATGAAENSLLEKEVVRTGKARARIALDSQRLTRQLLNRFLLEKYFFLLQVTYLFARAAVDWSICSCEYYHNR